MSTALAYLTNQWSGMLRIHSQNVYGSSVILHVGNKMKILWQHKHSIMIQPLSLKQEQIVLTHFTAIVMIYIAMGPDHFFSTRKLLWGLTMKKVVRPIIIMAISFCTASMSASVLLTKKLSPIPSKLLNVLTITSVSLSPFSLAILFASLKSIWSDFTVYSVSHMYKVT